MVLATQRVFIHNKRFYKLVKEIIMGNRLRPTIANFFAAHSEEKIFAEKSYVPLYLSFIFDVLRMCDMLFSIATKIATCSDFERTALKREIYS